MKQIFIFIGILMVVHVQAQIELDLSINKGANYSISRNENAILLKNCSPQFAYKVEWDLISNLNPPFKIDDDGGLSAAETCSDTVNDLISNISTSPDEDSIKEYVKQAQTQMGLLQDQACRNALQSAVSLTQIRVPIPYAPLKDNQVITVTVTKVTKEGAPVEGGRWTFVLKTPEKSRWLVHYGLTYTSSLISKTKNYFSMADTTAPNKYTITRENDEGPKPWENISATINFTYPFHAKPKGVDGGFTAGFGLSAGFELSGQAGLSMIIGDNVILGTGIVMMQKYKLMGTFQEGQVIKDNLAFTSLHHKVWVPELYVTLGFRFGKNPFEKRQEQPASSSQDGETGNEETSDE